MKYIGKYLSGEILLTRECTYDDKSVISSLILMPVRKLITGEKKKNMLYLAVYIPVSPWPGTARECFGIYLMIKDKILTNFKDR